MYMYVRKCQYYQQAGTCTLFSGLGNNTSYIYTNMINVII